MQLRNIHFTTPGGDAAEAPAPTMEAVAAALPEKMPLRRVSVSPLEEYALRQGEVRPISDALAAMILSFTGRAEVTAKGIKIDRKELGRVIHYGHPDSIVCGDLSQRERKWFYVLNRRQPDRVHILDAQGAYVETLPEKHMPGALDQDAQAKELADNRRVFARTAAHLQRLHGDDTRQALEDARHNKEIATRYVQTLDAPAAMPPGEVAPAPSLMADRVAGANRRIDQDHSRRRSATDLGHALNSSRGAPASAGLDGPAAEDWTNLRENNLHTAHQAPTEIESW
jgi:hypothetical protein